MAPLPGPAAPPRLLLLPASAAQASAPPPGPASTTASPPRKRQRLAHLSPEEKALRRKLKNRVAAQSARDRKKARMGELERQAVEMEAQNQKLLAENRLLRERTHRLAAENQELRLRLGLPALEGGAHVVAAEASLKVSGGAARRGGGCSSKACLSYASSSQVEMQEPSEEEEEEEDSRSSSIETATGSAESAVLRLRVPLQQGQAQQSSALVVAASTWIQMASILQILRHLNSLTGRTHGFLGLGKSDLLLGILDSLDPDLFLRYSGPEPTCLEKLQQVVCGGEAASLPASPSSSLGPTSPKLEAVNELIHFDHEYTKPFFLEIVPEGGNHANVLVSTEDAAPPSPSVLSASCLQSPVSVKEEPVDVLSPELGLSHLFSGQGPPCLLGASSDSGYEGSPPPFSDLSSPLDAEYSWEEAFAKELFPQLISV
ncbi:X-box-binding protein 1 [Varanus komodoensis]|nr:X-box-binding protein 1 [Varanus komodoensis]